MALIPISLFPPNFSIFGSFQRFLFNSNNCPTNLSSSNLFQYCLEDADGDNDTILFGSNGPLISSSVLDIFNGELSISFTDFYCTNDGYYLKASSQDLIILIQVSIRDFDIVKLGELICELGCVNTFDIGCRDAFHFWLQCSSESDFCNILPIFSTKYLYFDVTFTKWPFSNFPRKSTLFPTIFKIHSLNPEHLTPRLIFLAGSLIGRPLHYFFNPTFAFPPPIPQVLIEYDLSIALPTRVLFSPLIHPDYWICFEAINPLPFCPSCVEIGHDESLCHYALGFFNNLTLSSSDED